MLAYQDNVNDGGCSQPKKLKFEQTDHHKPALFNIWIVQKETSTKMYTPF